jgi:putative Mg2+ transporter-C (MgtC) family protein
MQHVAHITNFEIAARLIVALVLSGAIGVERELRERGAGLRTHIMVGLGSALFTLVSAYGFADFYSNGNVRTDPTRIAAQIVSGIGFLGAGAIIRNGLSVKGLTTAATLWAVAAIGLSSGAGFYVAASITTILILLGLGPMRFFERKLIDRWRPSECVFVVGLIAGGQSGPVVAALEKEGIGAYRVQTSQEGEGRVLRIECELPSGASTTRIADMVMSMEETTAVSWEN